MTAANISDITLPPHRPNDEQAIADLAFGDLSEQLESLAGRHLALLPSETLELDLSDPAQRQLGDYELLEWIGEGGMGVVYRARQSGLEREVAVKLLAAGPWASRQFIERFRREAQNAARMQHPNIVAIYEVGSAEELHFFSMRLIRGSSLAALLKRDGPLDPRRAASLLLTVAEAVDYAHRLGVLHLDLKPANVLVDEDGNPHVADFGLARRLEQGLAADNDEVSGTPSYMAPEQATAGVQNITRATDVWGLGAILYELVTGKPPFLGNSAQGTLQLVVAGSLQSPRRHRPELPRDLEAIILKCIARDTDRRYASARALADDLTRFLEGREVYARRLNSAQRAWRWAKREPKLASTAALAAIALLTGLVTATVQWRQAKQNAVLAQHNADLAQKTLWKSRNDTAQGQMEHGDAYPALANAVANLREMEAHGDRADAALERLSIGTVLANAPQLIDAIPLGHNEQIAALAISPDGKSVAAVTDRQKVYLIDVNSGRQRWVVETKPNSFGMTALGLNRFPLELHFSDDGRRLIGYRNAAGIQSGVNAAMLPHAIDGILIDVANGNVIAPPKTFADFLAVSYSQNGRYALLFDKHGGIQRWRTMPWSEDGKRVRFAKNIAASTYGPQLQGEAVITDDGATMVLGDPSKLRLRSYDAARMRLRRTLALTTEQDRVSAWAIRHDDRQFAIGTTSGQLAVWDPVSGETTWLHARLRGWIGRISFSADDRRLLAASNEPGEMRVFDAHSLNPVAPPVLLGNSTDPGYLNDAVFGPDADTMLTRHADTDAIVWRLPEPGFPLHRPIAVAPPMVANGARFALARDRHSRLMATADNGRLKLWRVRWTPYVGGMAAPMVSDTLRFDGKHLVSVNGNLAGVFDVATGESVGRTIALPEAPTFAELDGSGTRLVAIAGRELSCWHWRDGKPCWPSILLPNSPLRVGLAAKAPMLAVSTGGNKAHKFFEQVRLIDLATGQQRGSPIAIRGPLGALRLSNDGRRLLVFEDWSTIAEDSNVVRVIDTASVRIVQNLVHTDKKQAHIIDARFADDDSIWSFSGATGWGRGPHGKIWHWNADGKPIGTVASVLNEFALLPLPHGRGVIETDSATVFDGTDAAQKTLSVPGERNRVNAAALSPDGNLLALGTLDGVGVFVIDHNQNLAPQFNLALPNHDAIQQLAFAPDGSRLIGRTISGHWFRWRIVSDARPVAAIEQDLHLRDFTDHGAYGQTITAPPLPAGLRRKLRSADPGPAPEYVPAPSTGPNVPAHLPDSRYRPLNIDAIGNVDPRLPMNRTTRVPPLPQSMPTLPHGLQRYDGADFQLGRAVQLSATPLNQLNAPFPARSSLLRITPQLVSAVDTLVFQFQPLVGEIGEVRLHFTDGGERTLSILAGRDTFSMLDINALISQTKPRIGWLGNYATSMHGYGMASSGESAAMVTTVVRLENPEPNRPVAGISLEAPSSASPGLLFLALTLEPANSAN